LINAGLGGSVSQFLEVPNRQYMKNKSKHRSPWGTSLRILPWDKQDEVLEAIHGLELEISELEGYLEETIHVNECDTYEGLSLDEIIKREREATRKAREQQEKEQEDFER